MDRGRVKSDTGLHLRAKPNGIKTGVLAHNERFTILDETVFYRVQTADGRVGYVHGAYVERLPDNIVSDKPTDGISSEFRSVSYDNPEFIGEKVKVDIDFVRALNRVANYAADAGLKIWVTSSLRPLNNQVRGAIVPPAARSCHHIGHAIDMNLMHNGTLYNSSKLKRSNLPNLPQAIQQFINAIRQDGELRWGGDFSNEDPVHIDDDFFHKQELLYLAKLQDRVDQLNA